MDIFTFTLHELQMTINRENKDVFILGDINIDILKFQNHHKTNEFLDNTFASGFIPLITRPTRVTQYSATLIDHVNTRKREIDSICGIIICDISDHFGIFSICHLSQRNKQHDLLAREFRSYKFSTENVNTFQNILNDIDFTRISSINCPNEAYDKFMEIYCAALNVSTAFPLRKHISPRKFQKHCVDNQRISAIFHSKT